MTLAIPYELNQKQSMCVHYCSKELTQQRRGKRRERDNIISHIRVLPAAVCLCLPDVHDNYQHVCLSLPNQRGQERVREREQDGKKM